tara:strand:+ start:700 stop:960 length:261 start_codon:yes stop_codon:yes gene_type:complete
MFDSPGYTLVIKQGCPWCKKARTLMTKHNIPFIEVKVSLHHGADTSTWGYDFVKKRFKSDTFPIIYDTAGRKVGGYTELKEHLKYA